MKKRLISAMSLAVLLTGCAGTSGGHYYGSTVQSWQGGHIQNLTQRWGTPDTRVRSPNGEMVYLYKTHSSQPVATQGSPTIGVNFNGQGRPVIVTTQTPPSNWDRGQPTVTCAAMFVVNAKGEITETKYYGDNCFNNPNMARQMANPNSTSKNR